MTSASVHQVLNILGLIVLPRKLKEMGAATQLPSPLLQLSCSHRAMQERGTTLFTSCPPPQNNLCLAGVAAMEWVLPVFPAAKLTLNSSSLRGADMSLSCWASQNSLSSRQRAMETQMQSLSCMYSLPLFLLQILLNKCFLIYCKSFDQSSETLNDC